MKAFSSIPKPYILFNPLTSTDFIGKKLLYMPSCHSTNEIALELIKSDKSEHGLLLITDEQTAGKGQRGNSWLTEPFKNLTFSFAYYEPTLSTSELFNLNMAICIGILNALKAIDSEKASDYSIKWPNDMYYKDNKLGGILIETVIKPNQTIWAVIGIGINVNQTDFGRLNATSLQSVHQKVFNLQEMLENISLEIETILRLIPIANFEFLRGKYLACLFKYQRTSLFKKMNGEIFEGKIIDVNSEGRLIIQTDDSTLSFNKQEIQFMR